MPISLGTRVVALAALMLISASCQAVPDEPTDPDPFPSLPPDGPLPEIGRAPDSYRPTAAGAPSTDIWIGHLVRSNDGLALAELSNATDRDGYDNQPFFAPGGDWLYYASAIDSTQTEIFRYDLDTGTVQQVTRTADASEFSPVFIPERQAFSAIRETRAMQYLWRYGADGQDLGPIFSTAEPVGYHAWASPRTVAMFILGDPPTLQIGDAISGTIRVAAENPGRSVHRIPRTEAISFVRKLSEDEWWIERLHPSTGTAERLVQTFPGREDYAWTPEGEILTGNGTVLYAWTDRSGWIEVASLDPGEAGEISRLAVSPDGSRIAVVRNRLLP